MKDSKKTHNIISSPFPLKREFLNSDAYYGMSFARIGPGLVISRTSTGVRISQFEDDEWYLPAFVFSAKDNPHFDFTRLRTKSTHSADNVDLCKKLFIMKMFSMKSKTGKPLRLPTMHAIHLTFYHLCVFCNTKNICAQNVFSDKNNFTVFQQTLPESINRSLVALIRTLNHIDTSERGFALEGSIFPFMKKISKDSKKETQQHPVIPSRILYLKYNQYKECIDDFTKNFDNISNLVKDASDNIFYARDISNKSRMSKKISPLLLNLRPEHHVDFKMAIHQHQLDALAKKYNWRNMPSVATLITLTQHCAKNLVHLLTLMRDQEALSLNIDCLEAVKGWNNDSLYVLGTSTKLSSEPTPTKWITTEAIKLPIDALVLINKILSPHVESKTSQCSLFIMPSALPFANNKVKNRTAGSSSDAEYRLPPIFITEEDIQELESIDPMRSWRSDKRYLIGQKWKVTSHQFRRSIAVFAGQSGLMTLPSLKRLLQHLTKVMSTYYMKGCAANNYFFSKINPKLTLELKRAKEEADNALFIRDALHSAEKLYGFSGRLIMKERTQSVWLSGTEADSTKQTKLGLNSWQPSPLGGCASPVPCDRRAHADYTTCPGCKHLVGMKSKMDESIKIMEFDLMELSPGTIEYRAEKQNLEDFRATCSRITDK